MPLSNPLNSQLRYPVWDKAPVSGESKSPGAPGSGAPRLTGNHRHERESTIPPQFNRSSAHVKRKGNTINSKAD